MLELQILQRLIYAYSNTYVPAGEGFDIARVMRSHGVPRATFYRAVNELIDNGMIVRVWRGHYALSPKFKEDIKRIAEKV